LNDNQRYANKEILLEAGFKPTRLINESTAAAMGLDLDNIHGNARMDVTIKYKGVNCMVIVCEESRMVFTQNEENYYNITGIYKVDSYSKFDWPQIHSALRVIVTFNYFNKNFIERPNHSRDHSR
jgi:hypothetical protein